MAKYTDSPILPSNFVRSYNRNPIPARNLTQSNEEAFNPDPVYERVEQDVESLFRSNVAYLTGGRDKKGGPIIQINSNTKERSANELVNLLNFLSSIPDEKVRTNGFSILIDCQTCLAPTAKFTIKILNTRFSERINFVYILKPNSFWERRRSGMSFRSKTKYNFSFELLNSAKELTSYFDLNQLLPNMGGSLIYDHDLFTSLYLEIYKLLEDGKSIFNSFSGIYNIIQQEHLAANMNGAQKMLTEVEECQHHLAQKQVEKLKSLAAPKINLIRMKRSQSMPLELLSNSPCHVSNIFSVHVDLLASASQLEELVSNLVIQKVELAESARKRRIVLSECYSHRKFENEIQNVLSWIHGEGNSFIMKTNTIGITSKEALKLQETHNNFVKTVKDYKQKCKETALMAENLIKSDHYASMAISDKAQQVNLQWKSFNDTVEERSAILNLAIFFYQKSEHFFTRCDFWQNQCESDQIYTSVTEVREACRLHEDIKNIYENHFEQVSKDGYTLIEIMRKPIPQVGKISGPDYILDIKHVREILHYLKDEKSYIDDLWKQRHKILTHSVQSRIFQVECEDMCNWIITNGFNHLTENIQIGTSTFEISQDLLKHQEFEMKGKKYLAKFYKLEAMSKDLISFQLPKDTGNSRISENEITKWINNLDRKQQKFIESLNERESILKNTLNFYKSVESLISNFECQIADSSQNLFPESVEATEKLMTQIKLKHASNLGELNRINHEITKLKYTMEAAIRNLQQECEKAKNKPLYKSFYFLLDEKSLEVKNRMKQVEEIFENRLSTLDVCLNLRVFETDVHTHRCRLETWHTELTSKLNKQNNLKDIRNLIAKYQKRCGFLKQAFDIISENSQGLSNQIKLREFKSQMERTDYISHIQKLCTEIEQFQIEVLETAKKCISEYEFDVSFMELEMRCSEIFEHILAIEKEIPIDIGESSNESQLIKRQVEHLDNKIMKYKVQVQDIYTSVGQNLYFGHPKLEVLKYLAENLTKSWTLVKENIENRKAIGTFVCEFHDTTDNLNMMFDLFSREFNTISVSEVSSKDRLLLKKFRDLWEDIDQNVSAIIQNGDLLIQKLENVTNTPKLSSISGVAVPLQKEKQELTLIKEKYNRRFTYIVDMISQKKLQADEIWNLFEPRLEIIYRLATFQYESENLIYWLNTDAGPELAFDEKVKYNVPECTQQLEDYRKAFAQLKAEKDAQIRCFLENGKELQIQVATQFKIINKIQHIIIALKTSWQQFQNTARSREMILEKALRFQRNLNEIQNWRKNTSHFFLEIDDDLNKCSSSQDVDDVIKNLANCIQNSGKKMDELIQQVRSLSNELGGDVVEKQKFSITYNCNMTKEELEKYLRRAHDTKYKWEQIEREKNKENQLVKFRVMAFEELIKTEDIYIRDLETIIDKYVDPFPVEGAPESIINKEYEIFSNIREIFAFHKTKFLPSIIDRSPNDLANSIIQYQGNFEELYLNFCRDRKESEKILTNNSDFFEQWQQRVGEPFSLVHQLIKPVQRLPRYKLLLEKIIKTSKDLGEDCSILEHACRIVQTILNTINNEVDLLHLEAYEGVLTHLGKLMHKGFLNLGDKKSTTSKPRHVFLFTLAIIFAKRLEEPAKENGSNTLKYICKEVYFLEDFKPHIVYSENDSLKFTLIGKSFSLYLKAESLDIREDWVKIFQGVFENLTLFKPNRPFFKPKSGFSKIINRSVSSTLALSPQSSSENQYTSSPKILSSSNSTLSSTPSTSLVSSLEETQIPTPPSIKPPEFPSKSYTISLHNKSSILEEYSLNESYDTPTNEFLSCTNYKPDSNNPNGVNMRTGDKIEKIKSAGNWSWVKVKSKRGSFSNLGWVPTSYLSPSRKLDSSLTMNNGIANTSIGLLHLSLTPKS